MGRVRVCDECNGRGLHTFDRGPAVERCTACGGVGVTFSNQLTAARDFFDALTSVQGADLAALDASVSLRVLASLLVSLEERCAQLEAELGRLH